MDGDNSTSFTRICDLNRDSKTANLMGRVCSISKVTEFQRKDGSNGRVVNVRLSDGTGIIRMVLWDRQTIAVEEGNLNVGDVIQIVNGIVRESMFDSGLEVVPGRFSLVNLVESGSHSIPLLEELNRKFMIPCAQSVEIKDLAQGISETKGTVVDVIRGRNIFFSCPVCGNRVNVEGDAMRCAEHGDVAGEPVMVFNAVLDDGTGSIRAVFFRDAAEKALGTDTGRFASMGEEERRSLMNERLLGKDIVVTGRVKRNEAFDRMEMVVSDVRELDPLEEGRRLVEELEREIG